MNVNPSIVKNSYKPQNCPPGNVLYRITFRYKTNFSGNKLFNLTKKNFPDFTIDIPNRPLRPGDYVRYTPRNKNDFNHGKLAMIESERNKRLYGKIVKTYDLIFISPVNRNNKIIRNIQDIPQNKGSHTMLTLIPQIAMYLCSSPFVPISIINNYLTAYKNYSQQQTSRRLRILRQKGAELFDSYFKLGNNNEPLYPEFVARGQPNFDLQERMKLKLNKEIKKIVKNSFLSKTKSVKPKIKGSGNKKTLEFPVPRGFKSGRMIREDIQGKSVGGRLITIPVDKYNVNVRVPIGVKALDRITVPIERRYNESIYESLEPSSKTNKKTNKITFLPNFILAKFSNTKQLDIHKLVKPSKDQSFFIKDATIIPQSGANFIFKKLTRFNKKNNPLIFDIEVHVDLRLSIKKNIDTEASTKSKIFGKVGDFIQNSGNGCPTRMRNLKLNINNLSKQIDKERTTVGERITRTRKKRRAERKKGKKLFNKKIRQITRRRARGNLRKYGGKRKKGGDYSQLAKETILKQAKRYPKQYKVRVESKTPGEILKKKKTQKVYRNKYPGSKGGKRKLPFLKKKRKSRRKKKSKKKRKSRKRGGGLIDLWNARMKYKNTKKSYKLWSNFFNKNLNNHNENKNNEKNNNDK